MSQRSEYCDAMSRAADTSREAAEMMLARFESMTHAERATIAAELNEQCTAFALAGIRSQHGALGDDDVRWHLAMRRYGEVLANEVYGVRSAL